MWASTNGRSGLRVRGARAHPVVRGAAIRFAAWLRGYYEFPVRLPIYLSPRPLLISLNGEECSATFFAPWEPTVEPYIRVATGDYLDLRKARGRDDALSCYLCSIAHEIVHYQQWIDTGEIWERGVVSRADRIVDAYATHVPRP
jgi:hypothetical protein